MKLFRWTALAVLAAPCLLAQTAGRLAGTVSDATGAPLPGVSVTAEQTPTGLSRSTQTDGEGRYVLASLPASVYRLKVERDGFRPVVREGIELTVAASLTVDLTLQIGAIDQQITITDRPSMVNTQTSELSFLVGEMAMRELPLNGRNYTDLALLTPGVTAFPHRDGGSVVAHGLAMSMNGRDPRSNVYLIDGTPQNDFTNAPASSAAGTALGLEAIREFRVELNAYSAEFGRNSGGQVNALTKSGGNEYHGSLFHFLRNDNFDARNFFDPAKRPEFNRNQFGGSLGGPIRREKTFFFTTYESLRERLGRTISTVVPDENARLGILPDGPVTINPVVRPYLDEYPLPNGPSRGGGLAQYAFGFNQTLDQHFGQGRLDHYFNSANQMFARYTIDDAAQRLPTDYPQFPRSFLSRHHFLTLEHAWVPSGRTTHTFRGSFARTRIGQDVEANTARALDPFIPGRGLPGNIDIGGLPRWGPQTSVNVQLVQNLFGFDYFFSHVRGRHLLKGGMLAERYRNNMVNPTFSLGIQTFSNLRNFLENRPLRFLGLPAGGAIDRYWRSTLMGFYLQDDWRVVPRLTLNLGIRYEFATMPRDIYGRDSAVPNLLSDATPTVGQLYQNPTYTNLSPRAGFAWDVLGTGRLSVRGGYGLFFNTNNIQHLIVTVTNPPATPRVIVAGSTFPVPNLSAGVANSIRPIQWDIESPRVHVYNLMAEYQLPGDLLISAGFAGSRGSRLWRSGDWNTATPERQPDGALVFPAGPPRRRNPNFGVVELKSSDGDSWYNAGLFELRRRFGRGLMLQSSYTFSRNIDTTQASTFFSDATNGTTTAFPEFEGLNYNKGLADYHAKHNWVSNFVWSLPLGRNYLARGWQLAGIYSMRSGNPLTVFVQANRSRSLAQPSLGPGIGFDRVSMAPGFTHQSAIQGDPARWFNPAAFALQPAGQLGNLGRGALIGPNLRSFDVALMRNFALRALGEKGNLQFRAEMFNLANRANFGPPGLTAFAGTAPQELPLSSLGLIRQTVTSARQLQLALRLSF
ncbi:MAG: carboxypeptidase regulatory-like domain-containing protein [Bryobacteraceae bacterium]|nr:carboxypeptidase regulatory-like domain-containing protein [Bryobacteraceae bacterium]